MMQNWIYPNIMRKDEHFRLNLFINQIENGCKMNTTRMNDIEIILNFPLIFHKIMKDKDILV